MMISDRERYMAIVDGDTVSPSNAIVLLEGDGFNRCAHAVHLYREHLAPIILFSGSAVDYKYGSIPFDEVKPKLIGMGVPENILVYEKSSKQTRQQADEVLSICEKEKWDSIILVASNFHQYRAYLTFLKSMFDKNLNICIFNSPAKQLSWFEDNVWGSRYNLLSLEFQKIEKYQSLGDIASFQDAIRYQQWKEKKLIK